LTSEQPEASLIVQLQQYLQERSYQVTKVDAEHNLVTFEGIVQPSVFLAIFLTLLAAIGTLCLALVLSFLFPSLSKIFILLVCCHLLRVFFTGKKRGVKSRCH
jgi:succinate-acetate transporter protein